MDVVRGRSDLKVPDCVLERRVFSLEHPALLLSALGLPLDLLNLSIFELHLLDELPPLMIVGLGAGPSVSQLFLEHHDLVGLPLDQVAQTLQLADLGALVGAVAVHKVLQLPAQLL